MDCEKFDQHVMDALYDELDELTFAALKRHIEGCSRCAGVWAGLRATREVGVLPIVEPPPDLEDRILDAVAVAQKTVPFRKKLLRGLAWAGSHAMRPQLAMAALFFLVIGSSLLLLRARPGTVGPVQVSEVGSPTPEIAAEPRGAAPPPAAVAAATAAAADSPLADNAPPARRAPEAAAERESEAVEGQARSKADTGADARAALADAIAVRNSAGCAAAVGKLDEVAARFAGTQSAADAMWAEASCYKQMGDGGRAQQLFLALRSTGYRERAQAELDEANANNLANQAQVGGKNAAGASAPAAAAAPKAAPRPPEQQVADAKDESRGREAAGAPAAAKAAKARAAAPAPAAKARPAPAKSDAAFAP